jgi:Uma2 family endonuclease
MGPATAPRIRALLRREYEQLVAAGAFDGERLELLEGELVVMSPQNARHAWAIDELAERLRAGLGGRARLRVQTPLALSDHDEPEPDLAVVPLGDYRAALPTTALLVVEVADTSRAHDLGAKSVVYARAGIPEYWVLDLVERRIVVHTEPRPDGYAGLRTLRAGTLSPAAFPDLVLDVAAAFP